MKLAVFTPLNPARCGIADYSEALLSPLARHVSIDVFIDDYRPQGFSSGVQIPIRPCAEYRPDEFDATVYHIGNNPHHSYIYETAIRHPGIVVLHEINLHHLVADITIRRGDWDAYLREVEYNGGSQALEFAHRVKALEVGPDYEGVAMNRRLIENSRALIVHSRFMVNGVAGAGYDLPVKRIPHGAWIPEVNRNQRRTQLGVDETTPLIGIFGFLKPYKRITEALRAMQRLIQVDSRARMILVGEQHSDYPVGKLIAQLGLERHVRVLGYVPVNVLAESIGAADICLNLRYPTAGETSGTLQRALGLGRAVLVSDVGAFSELPDEICFKVGIGEREVDLITDYLRLLCTRPEVGEAMGARARHWVSTECNWDRVAQLYAEWIEAVVEGRAEAESDAQDGVSTPAGQENGSAAASDTGRGREEPDPPIAEPTAEPESPLASYILGFCQDAPDRLSYVQKHLTRLVRTIELTPSGESGDRILEMGAYLHITPALKSRLGYGEVRGSYLGPAGRTDHRRVASKRGEVFECQLDLFDAEKDVYPYPDGHFSTVLCCELLEHLSHDPMHLMAEISRILKPGGHLVLTTPNICSSRAAAALLLGYHPGLFHQYVQPGENGEADPRHSREYAPRDVQDMLEAAGFRVDHLDTGSYIARRSAEFDWVMHLLRRYKLPDHLRGDVIYAVGKRIGDVGERFPSFLYARDSK